MPVVHRAYYAKFWETSDFFHYKIQQQQQTQDEDRRLTEEDRNELIRNRPDNGVVYQKSTMQPDSGYYSLLTGGLSCTVEDEAGMFSDGFDFESPMVEEPEVAEHDELPEEYHYIGVAGGTSGPSSFFDGMTGERELEIED